MKLTDISKTALTTLKCHIIDATSNKPILMDTESLKMWEYLCSQFPETSEINIRKSLISHICLRAKRYDDFVREFLKKHREGIVVNVGCGFDNRFSRVDNGRLEFYDLDLPGVISEKRKIFPEQERYKYLSTSVFETGWMENIPNKPVMILAEGVFMYFHESDIKDLLQKLHGTFDEIELVCEVFNSGWLRGWRKKSTELKLRKQLHFGTDAGFHFGIPDSDYFEKWNEDFKLLGDWSYLDSGHPSLGVLKWFRRFESIRKVQWSVHYILSGKNNREAVHLS